MEQSLLGCCEGRRAAGCLLIVAKGRLAEAKKGQEYARLLRDADLKGLAGAAKAEVVRGLELLDSLSRIKR